MSHRLVGFPWTSQTRFLRIFTEMISDHVSKSHKISVNSRVSVRGPSELTDERSSREQDMSEGDQGVEYQS